MSNPKMLRDFFRSYVPAKKKLKFIYTITYTFILIAVIILNANNSEVFVRFSALTSRSSSSSLYLNRSLQIGGLGLEELGMFESRSDLGEIFDSRVRDFFESNRCQVRIFMTWISAAEAFGDREFIGLETLFRWNPSSCLIILSKSMDSKQGYAILNPLINTGFRVVPITPNLFELAKNTSAARWLDEIASGVRPPGDIPMAQNLSNLVRLLVIYKYGGVYLDTDFIILRKILSLRNVICAQSIDVNGNWTRLNNAMLIFDEKHPLLLKFIEEFTVSFDGNIWGHNGPYLVSRVVNRLLEKGVGILPPMAFYPVDWVRIGGYFGRLWTRNGWKRRFVN